MSGKNLEVISMLSIVAIVFFVAIGLGNNLGFSITGMVTSEQGEVEAPKILDLAVKDIKVNPPSPRVGETFTVSVVVANVGDQATDKPFYVRVSLQPADSKQPMITREIAVTQSLEAGEEATASFSVAMITNEGAVRILAESDPTNKYDDSISTNDKRSKTLIIA